MFINEMQAKLAALGATFLVAIGLAGAIAPVEAQALPKVRSAKFKVTVKGWQKADFQRMHESTDLCDPSDFSSGGEYMKFRTPKSTRVRVVQIGDQPPAFVGKSPTLGMPAVAEVARNYAPAIGGVPPECGDNGGGAAPTAPDCGLREIPWDLELSYSSVRKDSLSLGAPVVDDPYVNCPSVGGFPHLQSTAATKSISSKLPREELFDPELGQFIVIGRGTDEQYLIEESHTTQIRWEVTLTRLGKG